MSLRPFFSRRTSGRLALGLLAFALIGSTAHAADAPSAPSADVEKIIYPGKSSAAAPVSTAPGSGFGSLTLTLGVLLAGVGGWLVWRGRNPARLSREARLLNIEETRPLGNRQYLVVASYQDKKFLLGVCQGRIEKLAALHDSEEDEIPS